VIPTVIANAFLTAVLSETDSRYQARVVWLIPLMAALIALKRGLDVVQSANTEILASPE